MQCSLCAAYACHYLWLFGYVLPHRDAVGAHWLAWYRYGGDLVSGPAPVRQPPLDVRPLLRRKSDAGTFMTTEPGELVLLLDNGFSWLVDKRVQLDIQLVQGGSLLSKPNELLPLSQGQPAAANAPPPSSSSKARVVARKDDLETQKLREETAQAAHTAVEILDRVTTRVAERQARLGLTKPPPKSFKPKLLPVTERQLDDAAAAPATTPLKIRQETPAEISSSTSSNSGAAPAAATAGSFGLERLRLEKARRARLAALTTVPMRGWSEAQVMEWVALLPLPAHDAVWKTPLFDPFPCLKPTTLPRQARVKR